MTGIQHRLSLWILRGWILFHHFTEEETDSKWFEVTGQQVGEARICIQLMPTPLMVPSVLLLPAHSQSALLHQAPASSQAPARRPLSLGGKGKVNGRLLAWERAVAGVTVLSVTSCVTLGMLLHLPDLPHL